MSTEAQRGGSSAQDPEDADLVKAVRQGNSEAFDTLVARYQRRAYAVSWRLLNNRDDAMETVQDAFLRAFDRLGSLDDPARFGAWLLRIVSNLSLNRRRGRALRRMVRLDAKTDDESSPRERPDPRAASPVQQAIGADLADWVKQAIDELPERQRQALILFSIEKMPQKDVAEILDCSVEAVKWHVFAARKKLRGKLDGQP